MEHFWQTEPHYGHGSGLLYEFFRLPGLVILAFFLGYLILRRAK